MSPAEFARKAVAVTGRSWDNWDTVFLSVIAFFFLAFLVSASIGVL